MAGYLLKKFEHQCGETPHLLASGMARESAGKKAFRKQNSLSNTDIFKPNLNSSSPIEKGTLSCHNLPDAINLAGENKQQKK